MGKFEKTNRSPARPANPAPRRNTQADLAAQRAAGAMPASGAKPAPAPKKKKPQSKLPVILGILGALLVICSCVLGYLLLRDDGRIAENIYVAGIDLSGMTQEEALTALGQVSFQDTMEIRLYTKGDSFKTFVSSYDPKNEVITDIFGKPLENAQQTLVVPEAELPETDEDAPLDTDGLPYLRHSTLMLPGDEVQMKLDPAAAVTEALRYGREVGSKKNPERIDIDVTPYLSLNEEYIRQILENTLESTALEGTETTWEETSTTITDKDGNPQEVDAIQINLGTMGRSLDTEKLFGEIVAAYMAGNFNLQYVLDETFPEPCDLDGLFAEFNCEAPVNAFCDEDTYEITDGQNGFGFEMKEAYLAFSEALPGESVTLALTELVPMHTRETLEAQIFCDVLGYCESRYVWNPNRTTNLKLAAQAIDGYVLKPGETFSFNDTLGQRTAAKGYKEAGVYVGGRTEQQLGGGICQVASTLFYCSLYANLEVVERFEHKYLPDYIPYGMDATIYWGSLDYKFRNNTAFPIRIDCRVEDGKVYTTFVGTNTKDYTIEMKYVITSWTDYQEVTVDITPDMPEYETRYKDFKTGDVIQIGYAAAKVTTYMYKYDLDGNLISKEAVFWSDYARRDREIANVVGEEAPTESTDPSGSTDPSESSSEAPTESSSEAPTESSSEAPTESSSEAPTESSATPTESSATP